MARPRKVNRDKSFEIYKENKACISTKEIAKILNEKVSTVNWWKSTDEWDMKLFGVKNKVGGQPGNQNARTMGWYSERLDEETYYIRKDMDDNLENNGLSKDEIALKIMWEEIKTQWALIIKNIKELNVKNQEDHTKVVKKKSNTEFGDSVEYEVITAYEKQLKYTKEISTARKTLFELIEKYITTINKDWKLVSEEHKLRIEVLKAKINNNEDSKEDKIDKYLTAISKEVNSDN